MAQLTDATRWGVEDYLGDPEREINESTHKPTARAVARELGFTLTDA
jgi:hypothetical protein